MGKINLAKQNQYVEFAEKDDEGNIISESFKNIEAAIDNKVVFDNIVSVETIGGDKGIKKANLPTTAGTYKLSSSGILVVKANSASSITITAIYGDSMYSETRDPTSSNNFLFNENTRLGVKPIYWHTVKWVRGASNVSFAFSSYFIVLTNSSEPLTLTSFRDIVTKPGFVAIAINGQCSPNAYGDITQLSMTLDRIEYYSDMAYTGYYHNGQNATELRQNDINMDDTSTISFVDLGANRIN